jgi:molybdopterin-binding protein
MKISARNALKGTVKSIKRGAVNGEVVIQVTDDIDVVASITLESIDELELAKGQEAYAVFKASDTMVGTSHRKRGE